MTDLSALRSANERRWANVSQIRDFTLAKSAIVAKSRRRADQFLSYPCEASALSCCAKTDTPSSACIEAIIRLAKLVINGPQANTASPLGLARLDAGSLATVKGPTANPTSPRSVSDLRMIAW